jgi:transcriptional regulator with XRE-family HTH domain
MTLEEAFGMVVRRKRAELQISQEELAHRAGLDRTYVSAIERAKYTVSLKTVFAIAKAVKEDPNVLVAEVEAALAKRPKR